MTTKKSQRKRPGLLSHGRPPAAKPAASLSAKATRTLIRSHHQLQKSRAQALSDGNEVLVRELDQKIAANGGIRSYQLASKKGQSKDRGGDSSKVLLEMVPSLRKEENGHFRLLEIGALSTENACSKLKTLDVTRIDLNSQEKGILQQDFMERPLPTSDDERFHIISLSLVLNYVPDSAARGEMLLRTIKFLAQATKTERDAHPNQIPCLFLVLPEACITNSRYFSLKRLNEMTERIGYITTAKKSTNKLIYLLLTYEGPKKPGKVEFRKEKLNDGRTRNNFAITLSGEV